MKSYYKAIQVVSVKERLPETAGNYTVHGYSGDEHFITKSEFYIPSGRYGNALEKGFIRSGVTHWEEPYEEKVYTEKQVLELLGKISHDILVNKKRLGAHSTYYGFVKEWLQQNLKLKK